MLPSAPSPGSFTDSPTLAFRQRLVDGGDGPPRRPSPGLEPFAHWLLSALAPELPPLVPASPNPRLQPFEGVLIERRRAGCEGFLSGFWFPADGEARGAVLMVHPWLHWGQGFLHRRGRVETLRQHGYHVLTFDLSGFGHSAPRVSRFHDLDVEDALLYLQRRVGELPCHLWGVSAGGYWSHIVLSRFEGVRSAVFEDVPQSLLQWSWRMSPRGRPFYWFYRHFLPAPYRFLDQRYHAPFLKLQRVAYIGCEGDAGAPMAETRRLAKLAGGSCLGVPGVGHLGALVGARQEVFDLVLETFDGTARGGL